MKELKISSMVEGGKASAGPPLGPTLGPMGVNIGQVIAKINEVTGEFKGMKVPVTVLVNPDTKEFRVLVGSPPLAELLKKELNVPKFVSDQDAEKMNVPIGAVVKVTKMKKDALNAKNFKDAFKIVAGSCVSYGIWIDGRKPQEIQKDVDEGKIDPEKISTQGPWTVETIVLKKKEVAVEAVPGEAKEGEAAAGEAKAEEKGAAGKRGAAGKAPAGKEAAGKKEEKAPAGKAPAGKAPTGKEAAGKKEEKAPAGKAQAGKSGGKPAGKK